MMTIESKQSELINNILQRSVVLDFEVYYDDKYSLKRMSASEFVNDERFRLHAVGLYFPDGRQEFFVDEDPIRDALEEYMNGDYTLVAHNMSFDALILQKLFPGKKLPKLIDTLYLANHVIGPAKDTGRSNALASVAEYYGFDAKLSLEFMMGVEDPSPQEIECLKVYTLRDVELTYNILVELLNGLSRPEFELWVIDHTLKIFLEKGITVDVDTVSREIKSILERKSNLLSELGDITEMQLSSNKQLAELLAKELEGTDVKVPMKQGKNGPIPALSKKDMGFQQLEICGIDRIEKIIKIRKFIRSSKNTVARLARLEKEGRVKFSLSYHGAITGRWTGSGNGWNPQNIPNPLKMSDPYEYELAHATRKVIQAAPGKVFIEIDAAQIEARVLAWLAGESKILTSFRQGRDIYSEFISAIVGEEIRKPIASDSPEDTIHFKGFRHVGKEAILGLGYSMGAAKFLARLESNPMVAEALGSRLSFEFCQEIVHKYRNMYGRISDIWKLYETAFHAARTGGSQLVRGRVDFLNDEIFKSLFIQLPSGRRIRYSNFTSVKGNYGRQEWMHGASRRVYGGLITENIVQGISRDLLAEAIYIIESLGYPVILTVHDSIIVEVDEDRSKEIFGELEEVMADVPQWAAGLPLASDGCISKDFNFGVE